MRIVHLSDFHLSLSGLKDAQGFIREPFIKDLIQYNDQKKIDLVLYTGDLIDKGGTSFKTIDQAFNNFEEFIINPILENLNLDRHQFIFIPGNHDIDRKADTDVVEAGLVSKLINVESISARMDDINNFEGIRRIIPFKDFENRFHRNHPDKEITNFQSCYIFNVDGKNIGIAAFNSAWRCYESESDFKKIHLGIRQITAAREFLKNCEIKIALIHHQLDYFHESESELLEAYIKQDFDVLLCGHVHKGSNFKMSSVSGEIIVSIAPSNSALNLWTNHSRFSNGYTLIDFGSSRYRVGQWLLTRVITLPPLREFQRLEQSSRRALDHCSNR